MALIAPGMVAFRPALVCSADVIGIQMAIKARVRDFSAHDPAIHCSLVAGSGKEFYKLFVHGSLIRVVANRRSSLVRGLERLVDLSSVRAGHLAAPAGYWTERPVVDWRGVHLFVGPTALAFHKKLWSRYLLPLGFNKVVLQCERTEWRAAPKLRGGIFMKRGELATLCDWYRSVGVEVIPLVESFGHMEWLLGAYPALAFNPSLLYSADPRKVATSAMLTRLWKEVVAVTKARTVHFGLDEINLRGWPRDPHLVTRLWARQLAFLDGLSRQLKVAPVIWGDMAIAPGEAPDATYAPSQAVAMARRKAIPKRFVVTDWHYGRMHPESGFDTSLSTWRSAGFGVIAATWFRPGNIEKFGCAAIRAKSGILQTTWLGYESSDATMRTAMPQFSAMAIAGILAYSGRTISADEAMRLFRAAYFDASATKR